MADEIKETKDPIVKGSEDTSRFLDETGSQHPTVDEIASQEISKLMKAILDTVEEWMVPRKFAGNTKSKKSHKEKARNKARAENVSVEKDHHCNYGS